MIALEILTWFLCGSAVGMAFRDEQQVAAVWVLGAGVAVMFLRRSLERWWNEREKERS